MDLRALYTGAFVNWEVVAGSWAKRTVASRLLLFSARRYLEREVPEGAPEGAPAPDPEREATISAAPLPEEVKRAFAAPPAPPAPDAPVSPEWGRFVDAALAAELEMVSYGERPPLLAELRAGLGRAAGEAGESTPLGRWFVERRDALPGGDLPDDPEYLPV